MSIRRMHEGGGVSSFLTTALLVLTLFAGIFAIVWTVSGITSLEYQIGELENRKARALKERKKIESELYSLRSMQHVQEQGLGLSIPDRQRVFYVKSDRFMVRQAVDRNKGER